MAVQGERIGGGFILITGIDGTRYAVRQQAITVIYDADECRDQGIILVAKEGSSARGYAPSEHRTAGGSPPSFTVQQAQAGVRRCSRLMRLLDRLRCSLQSSPA
jgi:hypothetical protein